MKAHFRTEGPVNQSRHPSKTTGAHTVAAMAVLNFTLSEEGVSAFRDALICLNKFSEDVSLEARKDHVRSVWSALLVRKDGG